VPQFFQVLGAEGAVDGAMIATHPDRHAMTDDDLIAIIHDWRFVDLADSEDESLRRINDG